MKIRETSGFYELPAANSGIMKAAFIFGLGAFLISATYASKLEGELAAGFRLWAICCFFLAALFLLFPKYLRIPRQVQPEKCYLWVGYKVCRIVPIFWERYYDEAQICRKEGDSLNQFLVSYAKTWKIILVSDAPSLGDRLFPDVAVYDKHEDAQLVIQYLNNLPQR